jgi:hypothetical protein
MKRWILTFTVASIVMIAVVYLILWAFNGFHGPGLGLNGTIAITLGTVCASALGVALMALVFYSDRSGRDEDNYTNAKQD